MKTGRLFLCTQILVFLAVSGTSRAGNLYLTGHDLDHHCAGGNQQCNALGAATDFVRKCAPTPTKPILIVDSGTEVPRALASGAAKARNTTDPGVSPPFAQVVITPTNFAALPAGGTTAISTSNYSAIVFASAASCSGCDLSPTDIAKINLKTADIQAFFNNGGGLLYLAGAGDRTAYYSSVPIPSTAAAVAPPFTLTPAGLAAPFSLIEGMGATGPASDDNCCQTHNAFSLPSAGSPLLVLETDSAGLAETLASSKCITTGDLASGGFVEICKTSSITDPVTGDFTFLNPAFPSGMITVPVGACSGPIPVPVPLPDGTITITEQKTPGIGVSAITAYGYSPTTSIPANLLVPAKSDIPKGIAAVKLVVGDVSTETVVEFTNYAIPTGVLEICKDAAPGTTVSGSFSFTVSGVARTYDVPAGACSGPIHVDAGVVTVTETPRAGFQLVDVVTNPVGRLVRINIPAGSADINVAAGNVSTETVARFVNSPVSPAFGQLKICKIAGAGIAQNQPFSISAIAGKSVTYSVPAGPAAQGGFCVVDSTTYPVGTIVTVQETTSPDAYQVLNIAVNPPDRSVGTPNLSGGSAMVMIGTGFTEVTITNIGSKPTGQLKICKIAGKGIVVERPFTFSVGVPGTTPTKYTVPAGPAPGGFCIVDGTFPVGTMVTVKEDLQSDAAVTHIAVSDLPGGGSGLVNPVPVTLGKGFTEVAFTNTLTSGIPSVGIQGVTLGNFDLVNEQIVLGMQSLTYRADLFNSGPALGPVIATVTSLDTSSIRVAQGQGTLIFFQVPANGQVTSNNTFTILADPTVPLDFSKLQWTFQPAQGGNENPPMRHVE